MNGPAMSGVISGGGHSYPLPRPADDPRFTVGLWIDVVKVLTEHGYPPLTGPDVVELQQALFQFLYGPS